jgi:hypothetical protein
MKQFAIVLALAAVASGQDPKPTMIGPHRLGESFDEWMIAAKLDLTDICGQHPRSDKRMDYKQVCKTLTTLKAGGKGWFRLEDYKNDATFTWSFINARTTTAESLHLTPAATVLAQLTQAYGMATANRVVPYQNALGAKWECLEADWMLPDGAIIMAKETIDSLAHFSRWTKVTFYTKEAAAALANQPKLPNPFLTK